MLFKLGLITVATIAVTIGSCSTNNKGQSNGTVTFSPVPTASSSSTPSPTPPPISTPTPNPVGTMPYQVMIGQSFACGSTSYGSLTFPNLANPPLNANASSTLNGTHPIIIIDEVPGQTTPYAPYCTPPAAWGATFLLRFASYSDLLAQSQIAGVIPTPGPSQTPLFSYIMYDNETAAQPTTAPSELPSPGGPVSVPGFYYYNAAQLVNALPGSPNFMGTAGTSGPAANTQMMYGTDQVWQAWDAQSQRAGATVSSWQNQWQNSVSNIFTYNTNLNIFLGVGNIVTVNGTPQEATQAQLDAVMQAVPPNFQGVWMNCGTQSGLPNGFGLCAQGLVDTALAGDSATPYPIPATTSSPPALPPPSPYASSPSPSAAPQVAATLCIGQADGTGKTYQLANHDEFNQDTALNTAAPLANQLNVSDAYPAASPPAISAGVTQTTWSNIYSFGRYNGGLAGTDDSVTSSLAFSL